MSLTIDEMDLTPVARAAAAALKAAHPGVVFTSGRRDLEGQAHAMASNVIHNRYWITETYVPTQQRNDLQLAVNFCQQGASQEEYGEALERALRAMTDDELAHVSEHLSGKAWDVQPVAGPEGEAICATIETLPGLTKFLRVEGGLTRWHAQFA